MPFEQIFGWSGRWDDLPAAHAAAIFFDLLAIALLFLLGRRMRGPTLGVALAYAWVVLPVHAVHARERLQRHARGGAVLAALLAASYRSLARDRGPRRIAALAGLTKFAPLALAPLLATHGLRERARGLRAARAPWPCSRSRSPAPSRLRSYRASPTTPCTRSTSARSPTRPTATRPSRCGASTAGLGGVELGVQIAAVLLALALAVVPRRDDLVGLAAACAAVLIALQLGIEHWFYLYIPWFFPLVMLALLGRVSEPPPALTDAASVPARSSLPAAGAEQLTSTPISHGSSLGGLEAHRHLRHERLDRLLALDADHAARADRSCRRR